MTNISKSDVLKLAKLSRLSLTDDEINAYSQEITAILEYVELLQDTDLVNVAPTYQVTGLQNVTREDELIDYGVSTKELLKNAPALQDNQFKVRRMIQ